MIGMGLAASQMGDPDETIECLEAALDFSGGPKGEAAGLIRMFRPTIYVSLGDAYFKKCDLPNAMEYLEKARMIDLKEPLTPDLRYSLYGTLADVFMEYADFEEVKKLLPMLGAIAKRFPQANAHLANLMKKLKNKA
jgi:tetratricopeptide (TPR) repeat protein